MPISTSLMNLLMPIAGDKSAAYISAFQQSLQELDAHNHTSGNGAPIPVAGLNINAPVPFNDFSATALRSVQMQAQSAALSAPADNDSLFVYNGDLYFLNGSNQLVRLTNGSALFDLSNGFGFYGDYATYLAQAQYAHSTKQYTFLDDTGAQAVINAGGLVTAGNISAAQVACSEIYAASGYRYPLATVVVAGTSLAANTTKGNVPVQGGITASNGMLFPVNNNCSIVGLAVSQISGTSSGGTVTFDASGGGAFTAEVSPNTAVTWARGTYPVTAPGPIGIKYTTSSGWSPNTSVFAVTVLVQET